MTALRRPRVVIHGEDPGAMNFLVPPARELAQRGFAVDLLIDGPARAYVAERCPELARFVRVMPETFVAGARPDFVLVGTSENRRTRAFDLIRMARDAGVESGAIVDIPANAAYRFCGETSDPQAHAPRWILGPDHETIAAFAALGVPAARLVQVRNPRLDALRRKRRERREVHRAREEAAGDSRAPRTLVFAAEPTSVLEPHLSHRSPDYTLQGRGGSDWRTAIVLEEVLAALPLVPDRPRLVLRLHPKNRRADFAAYEGEIDEISSGGDPIDVLLAADAIVGMTSMILQEAVAIGTPALSIIPRAAERAWLPMIERGEIPSVTDRAAIVPALVALLAAERAGDDGALDGLQLTDFVAARASAAYETRAGTGS